MSEKEKKEMLENEENEIVTDEIENEENKIANEELEHEESSEEASDAEETKETKTEKTKPEKPKKDGKLKAFFKSRKAKKGGIALALSAAFIAAVVLLNVVVSLIATRATPLSVDLTQADIYELQAQTIDYAKQLKKDITVYVLMDEKTFEANDDYYVQANKLLKALDRSSDKITLKYVDLTKNPTFTSDYPDVNWNTSHLLLVTSGKDYRAVDAEDMFDYNQQALSYGTYQIEGQHVEQAVMTAILNVTSEEKVKVTILEGHGEESCEAFETLLKNNAFETETISLLNAKIAKDSKFVILYDPAKDIDEKDKDALSDWLYNDGKYGHTLVYLPNDQKDVSVFKNLNALLEEWGMAVENGYVFETDKSHMTNSQNPYLISIFDYNDEEYTKGLKDSSIPVVLFYTTPIDILDTSVATSLLTSSDKAVLLEKDAKEDWDYKGKETKKFNGTVLSKQGKDENNSYLLVIGSYDAWSSAALSANSFNNADYFINLFNKLASRDEIGITIEGKNLDSTELGATSSSVGAIGVVVRWVIPFAILLIGLVVWIRRRNK